MNIDDVTVITLSFDPENLRVFAENTVRQFENKPLDEALRVLIDQHGFEVIAHGCNAHYCFITLHRVLSC